jgi:hypothetical protein
MQGAVHSHLLGILPEWARHSSLHNRVRPGSCQIIIRTEMVMRSADLLITGSSFDHLGPFDVNAPREMQPLTTNEAPAKRRPRPGHFVATLVLPDKRERRHCIVRHKNKPRAVYAPGVHELMPQLVRFCDPGGVGCRGMGDAARIRPTALADKSLLLPDRCDADHPLRGIEKPALENGKRPSAHCVASTPRMTASQPIVSIVELHLRETAFHTVTLNDA